MREYLFSKYDLSNVLLSQDQKIMEEISNLSQSYIFNIDENELVNYLVNKYEINLLELDTENITVDQREVEIDVSRDQQRFIRDRSRPYYIKGNRISYYIPYTGDSTLLFCRASTFSTTLPFGEVIKNEIVVSIDTLEDDSNKINEIYNRNLGNILQNTIWVNNDVVGFNNTLKNKVSTLINARKEKLNKNISLVNKLGYPLRRRDNIPQTYSVPAVKKKIIPKLPVIKTKNVPPEPILGEESYELILKTISDMSLAMERSPKTFAKLKEEEIRDHFLMVLNSQFEGAATGETFNYEGKTDILIRVNNKNIFIAECKFWKGEKVLLETIDQLLGYVSWRDTKTAILLFNKNKEFSKVVNQVPEVVKKHSNFIKEVKYESETGSRFFLHHREDMDRELVLTILLFNIP